MKLINIMCGNACDNIEVYFDKKYFLRAASFLQFKNISYNEICSNVSLEINYYLNQGIFRNIYADIYVGNRNIFFLFKAKYYVELVGFVNNCDKLEGFVKEILVLVLNKILKRGFIGNSLNLNNLKQICHEEFSAFKNIQLAELTLHILKSHAANAEDWIILHGNELTVNCEIFKERYNKDLYNDSDNENSSSYWKNYKREAEVAKDESIYVPDSKFENLNEGQIELRSYDNFEFYLIGDRDNSHGDIIKTLRVDTVIKAFIRVKKENSWGYEFGYVFFIDSSTRGRYVLYYDNASWSCEDTWVKEEIDNFILAHGIKEIEIEVDSDFKANKDNLQLIVDKFNQHKNIAKDWISFRW